MTYKLTSKASTNLLTNGVLDFIVAIPLIVVCLWYPKLENTATAASYATRCLIIITATIVIITANILCSLYQKHKKDKVCKKNSNNEELPTGAIIISLFNIIPYIALFAIIDKYLNISELLALKSNRIITVIAMICFKIFAIFRGCTLSGFYKEYRKSKAQGKEVNDAEYAVPLEFIGGIILCKISALIKNQKEK